MFNSVWFVTAQSQQLTCQSILVQPVGLLLQLMMLMTSQCHLCIDTSHTMNDRCQPFASLYYLFVTSLLLLYKTSFYIILFLLDLLCLVFIVCWLFSLVSVSLFSAFLLTVALSHACWYDFQLIFHSVLSSNLWRSSRVLGNARGNHVALAGKQKWIKLRCR